MVDEWSKKSFQVLMFVYQLVMMLMMIIITIIISIMLLHQRIIKEFLKMQIEIFEI